MICHKSLLTPNLLQHLHQLISRVSETTMRFGRDLKNNKVPLWRHEYVDYDRLKTEIKLVRARSKQGEVLPGDCECKFAVIILQSSKNT